VVEMPVVFVAVPEGMTMQEAEIGIGICTRLGILESLGGYLLLPPGINWPPELALDADGHRVAVDSLESYRG
jgi:hypothetical protein